MSKLIIKRDGSTQSFQIKKIIDAVQKANSEVDSKHKLSIEDIKSLANNISKQTLSMSSITVETIQDMVENQIVEVFHNYEVAKKYIIYRYNRAIARHSNSSDKEILRLIKGTNKTLIEENSNKNAYIASTQRDLIAGEVSKDITKRMLLPKDIIDAHNKGILHFHDMDYYLQSIFNCCLINIGDMLDNGTVMNGKLIETPKSFQVACTVTTQIIAAVASGQYGGQSIDIRALGKYLRYTKDKYEKKYINLGFQGDELDTLVKERVQSELESGVQTIQYQINTLMTTNGQSPFVTLFMFIDDEDEYEQETAEITEEIIKQRMLGIKNEQGIYITPAFPKLIYILDECNNLSGGKYDYITKLAAACSAKRMYPDYISAKVMRENYEGNVFSPMGCVSGKEVIRYKYQGVLYIESFNNFWDRMITKFDVHEQIEGNSDYLYIDTPNDVEIYDTKKGYVKNKRIIRNTSEEWCAIRFSNGRCITCTTNHPFETENNGVVYAKDLTISDEILISSECEVIEEVNYDSDKAWFSGILSCKGIFTKSVIASFDDKQENDIIKRFRTIAKNKYNVKSKIKIRRDENNDKFKDVILKYNSKKASKEIESIFSDFEIYHDSNLRCMPNKVFMWNYDARLHFLAGIMDAIGYVYDNNNSELNERLEAANKESALQQFYLIQSLGMRARIIKCNYDYKKYLIEFNPSHELINIIACKGKANTYNSSSNIGIIHSNTCYITDNVIFNRKDYSYDVTTESEHFEVSGIYSHNCRSFLATWKDENDKYKFQGRFNQGVVSINLPQIGIIANGDENKFWNMLDERLKLCFKALMCRHKSLEGTKSDVSPVHWQYGAISRLQSGETIDKFLHGGYSTISLGYIGLYEVTVAMTGESHTTEKGHEFALKLMKYLRETCEKWKAETGIGFGLYGTPAESLCYRLAEVDKQQFGDIENITDKGYYTNSYHVDVRETIDAFSKFEFESEFQKLSSGGAISYVEIPNMRHNLKAIEDVIKFIYAHIQYAEFNTKSDYCHVCGFDGEIIINENNEWECPQCHNKDHNKMNVARRTCGYIGENFWNEGKTKEIASRKLHL